MSATDPGAVLAYTRAQGWHLIPSVRTEGLVEALQRSTPASPVRRSVRSVPSLADLPHWLDLVNAAIRAEQGYGDAA